MNSSGAGWWLVLCISSVLNVSLSGKVNVPEPCERDGIHGDCKPLPQCRQYVALLKTQSTTMEGLRVTQARQCGFDGQNMKVCCPTSERLTSVQTNLPTVEGREDFIDAFPSPGHCGTTRSEIIIEYAPSYRIPRSYQGLTNGRPVKRRNMALWMALLGYQNSAVLWKCAGSVISARHVLTAAHCIKPNLYMVRVGVIDLASDHSNYRPIDFRVKKRIIHEEYTKFHNDIGVVVLEGSIDFGNNPHIAPVCLPSSPTEVVEKLLNSTNGMITGWGETETGQRPNHLLYAYVKIKPNQQCAEMYRTANVTIDERVLCAGDEDTGTDACNGDSGGPLVNNMLVPDKAGQRRMYYYQLGIVSYGYRCSAQRHSGVYTNVTHFMPWLEEKVLGRPAFWAAGS